MDPILSQGGVTDQGSAAILETPYADNLVYGADAGLVDAFRMSVDNLGDAGGAWIAGA